MSEQLHILLADDDNALRNALGDELIAEGYKVSLAADGREAIDIVQKNKIDVAILDLKMPNVGGYEVLSFIKRNYPQTKTIMLTAFADIETTKKCRELGTNDFIEKPYDLGDVFDAIRFVTKSTAE